MTDHWHQFTEFADDREKRAFRLVEGVLGARPFDEGWASFEFVALEGGAYDVDLLALTPHGVFLLEFVTRRGLIEIGPRTWVHVHQNGHREPIDSPVLRARRKAKLLRSLLDQMTKGAKSPRIEPVVWITEPDVAVTPSDAFIEQVVFHPEQLGRPSVTSLLVEGRAPAVWTSEQPLDENVRGRLAAALEEAGIDRSGRESRYADWRLKTVLHAGPRHQDWLADHVQRKGELRRARIFSMPRDLSDADLSRLQEAARREHQILHDLAHPNILGVLQHVGSERRPGLLFEHPPGAIPLDQWLDAEPRTIGEKLAVLLQTAEALQYAHRKSVVHRALSPESILVLPDGSVRVFNWHTSRKDAVETGTVHVHDYVDDISLAYLAPELIQSPDASEAADVYGVGAIAFRMFAGAPPASSLAELVDVLTSTQGLRPSRLADGIPEYVDEFVYDATRALARDRMKSMGEVIKQVENIRASLVRPDANNRDPLDAKPGDLLGGRYQITKRIGSGATATALLARDCARDDLREVVLKIANSDGGRKRLEAEADALRSLDHKLVVDLYDTEELGERFALVLQNAGESLAERLRDGALTLDDVRRFGDDLCDILVELEEKAVLHRDIKPANIGIISPGGGNTRLMIFDFSLADVPVDAWNTGTLAYRDPALAAPNRQRWDEYADRYSAALTLYEMVTGRLPEWNSTAVVVDKNAAAIVESHLFPASVRERLTAFFIRAFQRDVSGRFDNAWDMREAWQRVFERTTQQTAHDVIADRLAETPIDARLSTLGLSAVAQDALDKLNIVSVRDLVAPSSGQLRFRKGLSGQVRSEILALRDKLLEHFPDGGLQETSIEDDDVSANEYSVDQILDRLTGTLSRDSKSYREFVAALLGQEEVQAALPWPTLDMMSGRTEYDRETFEAQFAELRQQWERKHALAPLRDDIVRLVENNEGAISDRELARRVLGLRGCVLQDPDERLAAAAAVSRAAIEAELAADEPRLFLARVWSRAAFVINRDELMDLLPRLGKAADKMVAASEVVSPSRATETLREVCEQLRIAPPSQLRLLTLAAEASEYATLSSRNELSSKKLAAARAIELCAGIFAAGEDFTPEEIASRVASRYPSTEPIPDHPELADLLESAGLRFQWDTSRREGRGAYVNRDLDDIFLTRSTMATSLSSGTHLPPTEQASVARQFAERLDYKRQYGGFLVMTTPTQELDATRRWLVEAHPEVEHVSFDRLFFEVLRRKASELEIDLEVVLRADARASDGEWNNLMQLLRFHVLPAVRDDLLSRRGDVLLTEPGLIARYEDAESMSILQALHEHSGTSDGPRMVWVLVPGDRRHVAPEIDGAKIPVLHPTEYVQVPRSLE